MLADKFGTSLSHHDPLSDAKAAGYLWMALPDHFNMTHSELLEKHGYRLGYCDLECYQPFSNAGQSKQHTAQPSRSSRFTAKDFTPRATPDHQGALYGKNVVLTGTLKLMTRRQAFQLSVDAGAKPGKLVSSKTDYLVLGHTNPDAASMRPGGMRLSSKQQKANQLADQGKPIRIIDEYQFICLIAGGM